jgi:phospholipid-transporting ATPase
MQIWVLTGDRQETAINIGMSCRLISESMNLVSGNHIVQGALKVYRGFVTQVIANEQSAADTEDFLSKRLFAIKNQRKAGDTEELALVIDGKTLTWALEKEISKIFLELAIMCKVC